MEWSLSIPLCPGQHLFLCEDHSKSPRTCWSSYTKCTLIFCEIFTLWPSSTLSSRSFLLSTSQHAFPKATTCHGLEMKYLLKGPIIELKNWSQRTVLFGDVRIWGLAGKINHRRLVLASLSCPRFFCLSLCFPSVVSKVVSAAMILCPESVALRGMD